jgi:hypothetical protein
LLDVHNSACFTSVVRPSDVFDLLRDGQPRTRAQLAETTGLARSTIAARIDVLLRLGLVAPYGGGVSTGGRPPSLLALNPGAWVVAGIDLGATHATAALADLAGTILVERRADLDIAAGPEEVLTWVEGVVTDLLAEQRRPVRELAAIGIGLPGPKWAREYYDAQLARGHGSARAYRALANRWLSIIWKLWQIGVAYDEQVHMANRLKSQPKAELRRAG